jgi:hypothetical protein
VNHVETVRAAVGVSVDTLRAFSVPEESPEATVWWGQVHQLMQKTILAGRGGEVAALVLLCGEDHAKAAAHAGVPVRKVQAFVRAARRRVRKDLRLRALVAEC